MKKYQGTKVVSAKRMTKKEYCEYRGWTVPADEDPTEPIYLVEYEADVLSKPNHPDHLGYITMSPAHVFDKVYKPCGTYLERVVVERDELQSRLNALHNAMNNNKVPESTRPILALQLEAMENYLHILNTRLE